ncbi:AAA family ATPase [uncultured Spongiibacter sp.]|uniref:AAA family ATPase n=1 Tax=uncultured Spongiibacter sp. TaxID=870896 RepID=UPI00259949C3|nr:AAA family ATPase [uncultured Spongiibacter sp.]
MSVESAISRLKETKIVHRNWQSALSKAFATLSMASPGDVVCITGPSRAGKTKLISELSTLLCGEVDFESTGLIPAVVVDAENTGPHGKFATKAFTLRMLQAVKHPMYGFTGSDIHEDCTQSKAERATESTLRVALENAFLHRKTRFLFIDEAQHVKYVSKGAIGGYAVLDSWKCMAKSSGLVLVVVGAYPILQVVGNSPHLIGRKSQIHFPRYYSNEEDLTEFARILSSYDRMVSEFADGPVLSESIDILYQGSLGCIGLLRQWIIRSAALCIASDTKLSRKTLIDEMLSKADLQAISAEIYEGETMLTAPEYQPPSRKSLVSAAPTNGRKGVPFQRNPKRYPPGNRTSGGK